MVGLLPCRSSWHPRCAWNAKVPKWFLLVCKEIACVQGWTDSWKGEHGWVHNAYWFLSAIPSGCTTGVAGGSGHVLGRHSCGMLLTLVWRPQNTYHRCYDSHVKMSQLWDIYGLQYVYSALCHFPSSKSHLGWCDHASHLASYISEDRLLFRIFRPDKCLTCRGPRESGG